MENQQLVSSSRQCSSTPVGFGEGLFSRKQCETLEHLPYTPDLAVTDFYLSLTEISIEGTALLW
jgi:hypothetical protein